MRLPDALEANAHHSGAVIRAAYAQQVADRSARSRRTAIQRAGYARAF
jgi:hypothetical protein